MNSKIYEAIALPSRQSQTRHWVSNIIIQKDKEPLVLPKARSAHENKSTLSRIPVGRPRTIDEPITRRILDEIAWNFTPSEMMDMTEDREVWLLNLELLPPQPSRKRGQWKKKKKIIQACEPQHKDFAELNA